MNSRQFKFLSLKWKLFLLLSLIFLLIALGISWAAWNQQQEQLEAERRLNYQRNVKELDHQVRMAQQRLVAQAEYLGLLLSSAEREGTRELLLGSRDEYLSKLQLTWGIDQLLVQLSHERILKQTGREDPRLDQLTQRAIANERPELGFFCEQRCRLLAAVPVLLEDSIGGVGLSTGVSDMVLGVRQASGWDTGILIQTSGRAEGLPDWGGEVLALSNPTVTMPLLKQLAAQQTFTGQGLYLLEAEDRNYELALVPMAQIDEATGYWLMLADLTDSYQGLNRNVTQLLAVILSALLLVGLLLVVVLKPGLRFLELIAQTLPSLARYDFSRVRDQLQDRPHWGLPRMKDELDMLAFSSLQLTDELERLEHEVRDRTLRLHRSNSELEKQRDFVSGLLDNAQAVILVQDNNGLCRSINQYGRLLLNRTERQCLNLKFETLFGALDPIKRDQLEEIYGGVKNIFRHEGRMIGSDGQVRTLSWLHSRLRQADHSDAVLSIGMDVTEQKQVQLQLQWLANHDPLTRLPNRTNLLRQLQEAIDQAGPAGAPLAVIFCDLDRFKQVNDTLGHPSGDELLTLVASRMRALVRGPDTVARLGGDEFLVMLRHLSDKKDVEAVADKLVRELARSYRIDGKEFFVSASLGVALYPDHGLDASTLIKHADVAMYQAKDDGRKQWALYCAERSAAFEERFNLEADLRYALERKELVLFYQPQVDAVSGRVIGVEALIRWFHPDQGMIPPDRFIPLAEETGLIVDIGEWVLNEACNQLRRWQQQGIEGLRMAVNLAGAQLSDTHLVERVERAVKRANIEPALVELEITETFIMSRPETTIAKLRRLKDMGLELSIDDFGTGYSSLSYLKKLPVDRLKIDKSFVFDIGRSADDEAIAKAVIALGHSLNLKVIAEGVESEDHVRFLKRNGCDEFQGFHFARPMPASDCAAFLKSYPDQVTP